MQPKQKEKLCVLLPNDIYVHPTTGQRLLSVCKERRRQVDLVVLRKYTASGMMLALVL
jgi:hypothetical protein